MEIEKCPYCGSHNLIRGVQVGNGESIGLRFVNGPLRTGVQPMIADMCRDCNSVIRIYVKSADKTWLREP